MHEPDGYREPNDMVIREAEASGGKLFPFCRLDPHSAPLAEAERALAAGARGIKLHPRAEGFALDHPDLQPVFALADERRPHGALPRRARDPGARQARARGLRPLPGHAPDPRPRGHLGPGLDLAPRPRASEPLLRHVLVVAERPPDAARARSAGPDPDGERRSLRHPRVGSARARSGTRSRSASTTIRCAP